ncbi:Aste57867_909 [Aphanomyces stellatus]|uniref:Aste57867_909 protein n=1 Tax=Aphanomyces stellatus TaxID=120398 RepID=A0A485K4W2_9STRA|nr:hypothetical protein As57867_000908 [Aphanomyces stellatus]VFT78133.1 Aste57867_909 [Aphanomyces stellatus]
MINICIPHEDILFLVVDYLRQTNLHQAALTLQVESGIDVTWLAGPNATVALVRQAIFDGKVHLAQEALAPLRETHADAFHQLWLGLQTHGFLESCVALEPPQSRQAWLRPLQGHLCDANYHALEAYVYVTSIHMHPVLAVWNVHAERMACFGHVVALLRDVPPESERFQTMPPKHLETLLGQAMTFQWQTSESMASTASPVWDCLKSAWSTVPTCDETLYLEPEVAQMSRGWHNLTTLSCLTTTITGSVEFDRPRHPTLNRMTRSIQLDSPQLVASPPRVQTQDTASQTTPFPSLVDSLCQTTTLTQTAQSVQTECQPQLVNGGVQTMPSPRSVDNHSQTKPLARLQDSQMQTLVTAMCHTTSQTAVAGASHREIQTSPDTTTAATSPMRQNEPDDGRNQVQKSSSSAVFVHRTSIKSSSSHWSVDGPENDGVDDDDDDVCNQSDEQDLILDPPDRPERNHSIGPRSQSPLDKAPLVATAMPATLTAPCNKDTLTTHNVNVARVVPPRIPSVAPVTAPPPPQSQRNDMIRLSQGLFQPLCQNPTPTTVVVSSTSTQHRATPGKGGDYNHAGGQFVQESPQPVAEPPPSPPKFIPLLSTSRTKTRPPCPQTPPSPNPAAMASLLSPPSRPSHVTPPGQLRPLEPMASQTQRNTLVGYSKLTKDALRHASVVAETREVQVVRALAFSHNGKYLVMGTNSRALRVLNVHDAVTKTSSSSSSSSSASARQLLPVVSERHKHHNGPIYSVAWHPKDTLVASGASDGTIHIIKPFQLDLAEPTRLLGHLGKVRSIQFCPTHGQQLCSVGVGDAVARVWDLTAPSKPTMTLNGHAGELSTIRYIGAGDNSCVTAAHDRSMRVWDLRGGSCEKLFLAKSPVQAVACHPFNEHVLVSGQSDGSCMVWDRRQGAAPLHTMRHHHDECRVVEWSPDGRWLLTASFDGTNCIVNDQWEPVSAFQEHTGMVLQGSWHPSTPAFATSGSDKLLKLWNI